MKREIKSPGRKWDRGSNGLLRIFSMVTISHKNYLFNLSNVSLPLCKPFFNMKKSNFSLAGIICLKGFKI